MSLRIKGMDMPKNCAECPILEIGSLEHYCPVAKEIMWTIDTESGKHNNCPLSEIPTPHGRLIDADELIKQYSVSYEDALEMMAESMEAFRMTYVLAKRIRNQINQVPTIIEAEEQS